MTNISKNAVNQSNIHQWPRHNLYNIETMQKIIDDMLNEDIKDKFVTRNFTENFLLPYGFSEMSLTPEQKERFENYKNVTPKLFGVDEMRVFDLEKGDYHVDNYIMRHLGYVKTTFNKSTSFLLMLIGRSNVKIAQTEFFTGEYKVRFKYKNKNLAIDVAPIARPVIGKYKDENGNFIEYKNWLRDDANMINYMFKEIRNAVKDIDKKIN